MEINPDFMDAFDAARFIGISHRRIKRLAKCGQIPHFRVPTANRTDPIEYRFSETELREWVDSLREGVPCEGVPCND